MIDINELRRLTQEATPGPWYIGSGTYEGRNIYSVEAVTDDEGFTYNPVVATAEDDDVVCWEANARLIAAANPAVISELLDRLEAAEADALEQARLNGMGSEREAALLSKLEAAEKERDDVAQQLVQSEVGKREISEAHDALQVEVGKLKDLEVSRCVKINGYIVDNARLAEEVVRLQAKIARMEQQVPVAEWTENRFHQYPQLVWNKKYRVNIGDKLYTLPGAKGE